VQRSEKTRYLIVEIAAEAVGSIHSHSHQVAVPKIGISNDQDGQDSNNSECHSAKDISGRVSKALNALQRMSWRP